MPTDAKTLREKAQSFDWDAWGKKFKKGYEPIYEDGVKLGAELSLEADAALDLADPFVSEFMTDYVGERIVQLQGTTLDRVVGVIRRTFDEGESKSAFDLGSKVLETVREVFAGYERYRADRIGRTETGFAFNHGTVLGADQGGFEEVDVTDGDSDPDCEEANGDVWTVDEALANPLEHPNCVRAFAPHVPDDDAEKVAKSVEDEPRDEHGRWSGEGDSRSIPKNPDVPHGKVVARSKYGNIISVRSENRPGEFKGTRRNGETVGTFRNTHSAADALRSPKNPDSFPSGYRSPDVNWKWDTRGLKEK